MKCLNVLLYVLCFALFSALPVQAQCPNNSCPSGRAAFLAPHYSSGNVANFAGNVAYRATEGTACVAATACRVATLPFRTFLPSRINHPLASRFGGGCNGGGGCGRCR